MLLIHRPFIFNINFQCRSTYKVLVSIFAKILLYFPVRTSFTTVTVYLVLPHLFIFIFSCPIITTYTSQNRTVLLHFLLYCHTSSPLKIVLFPLFWVKDKILILQARFHLLFPCFHQPGGGNGRVAWMGPPQSFFPWVGTWNRGQPITKILLYWLYYLSPPFCRVAMMSLACCVLVDEGHGTALTDDIATFISTNVLVSILLHLL